MNPLFFASDGEKVSADAVVESVRNRSTRLIFTSPEACVSGRLRSVLEESAKDGYLENLVVDEAHIIESWGIFFRVDFQMLSMLKEKWLRMSGNRLKTYLLSATFTSNTRKVLKKLFCSDSDRWARVY